MRDVVGLATGSGSSDRPIGPGHTALLDPSVPAPPLVDFHYDAAIVGLGYVGLPTALTFHTNGFRVAGVDISQPRLAAIRAGEVDALASDNVRLAKALCDEDGFTLTDDLAIVSTAEAVLVCVPTPIDEHLLPDLTALRAACQSVVRLAQPGQVLMLTSTTYVGCTHDLLVRPLEERGLRVGRDVFVAFAPERIDPGNADFAQYDVPRVVGGVTPTCTQRATATLRGCSVELYQVRDARTAEMTKLYENTFRAVNISLANEFADISTTLGLDITEVIDAAATKPFGFMPFYPGAGIGGHCIPCDPHYLLWQLRAARVSAPLIETAMTSVALRPGRVTRRAIDLLGRRGLPVEDARVLVLGVAYKPGVADVRESPALEIMRRLATAGARVSFADDRVSTVDIPGHTVEKVTDPQDRTWDLVVVQCVHPQSDLDWLRRQPTVLDATYRLADLPGRELP
jgi:UDP-N-acetyl-D-glucosamine dehydrogenase